MAQKTRAELQSIWVTGATMTETLFDDVWDSFLNIQDDTALDLTFNSIGTTSFQILGGTGDQGTMIWDPLEESVLLTHDGTTSHLNHDVLYHVRNNTGSPIPIGTPVYASGTVGGSGKITIAPMIADGSIPARRMLGVTTETIGINESGKVAHFGRVNDFDTTGTTGEVWNAGDILWVSGTTAGQFTKNEPQAPNLKLAIAFVAYSNANNGVLYVRFTEGHRIVDAHDVEITNPQNKDRLSYNSATQRWENSPPEAPFKPNFSILGATSTVDLSNEMILGEGYYTFGIDSSSSAVTVTLPTISNISNLTNTDQLLIVIKDIECNSFANPITIATGATDTMITTVTGATSFTIESNGGSINLTNSNTVNKWILT